MIHFLQRQHGYLFHRIGIRTDGCCVNVIEPANEPEVDSGRGGILLVKQKSQDQILES